MRMQIRLNSLFDEIDWKQFTTERVRRAIGLSENDPIAICFDFMGTMSALKKPLID